MKQKNMWLHLTLLLIGLIISKVQCAQIPQPTSFISVSSGNKNFVNESLNASEIWYKWTNTNDATNIKIKLKNQGSNAIITNAELYLLVNDSLTLINADILGTDSIIDFWNRDITVNSSIFIKIVASYSLCTSCLLVNASYELKLTNININSAYTASTCELVRDGELDTRWITGCNFHTITLASNFPATFWSVPPQSNSTISTPDYFADCAPLTPLNSSVNSNSNFASNGLCTINTNTVGAYTGMYVYNPLSPYREYLTNQLSQPVQVGKPYHLSLMVRLSCFSKYAISNLSLYFTNGAPVQPSVFLTSWQSGVMTPTAGVLVNFTTTPVTNTSDWTILTACFTPTAAFSHITLGNFETSINTTATDLDVSNSWPYSVAGTTPNTYNKASYYYFDKVSVKPIELIATGTATLCSGASSQLDAFLDCPLSNSYTPTYSWTPSYGLSATNISNPVANPTVTTQYTVLATIPNANGVSCAVTRTVLITAGSGVNPTITITPTQTICQGQSASITAGGATTYTWNTGSTNNPISVNPTINTNYNVIGTNAAGCTSTATTSIIVIPTLPVSLSPSSSMCLGSSVTLTASNGVSTYTWLPSGTASGGSTVTLTPTVTTTYTVLNYNSCNILNSAVTTVSVFPSPSYSLTSTNICVGSSISVISNSTTSITNLNFNYPNPITPATSQSPYTYNTAGNYSVEVIGENTVGGFCQTTTIFPVTVSALQPFAITYTSLPCSFNYTFTENFGCSSNVYDYTFDVNNGAYTITNNTGIFPYPFTASGTYTITGFSSYDYIPVTFTINVPPATTPTITLVASPSTTICAGSSVTLTASGGTTYNWNPTGLNTNTITVSPTVTTVYSVTSDCGIVKTITITVVPNPTISINNATICAGQSATLTASGGNTYVWSNGATTSSVVVSPSVTTQYTVTGTTTAGCTNTAIATVSVNPKPFMLLIPNTTSITLCPATSYTLRAFPINTLTYVWNTGATTNSIVIAPTVNTTYTVTGTSTLTGCSNFSVITVNMQTVIPIAVTSATICRNSTATLTASGSTSSYTWSNGVTNTNTISVSPISTTNYTVMGTTACGTSIAVSTVTVYNLPPAIINGGNTPVCAGTSITFTSAPNNTFFTYLWSTGSTTSLTTVTPSVGNTTYSLIVTNSNGCSRQAIKTVTVLPTPTINVTATSYTICRGSSTTLTATGATNYTWSPAGSLNTNNGSVVTASPNSSTTYTVRGSNGNGCIGIQTILIIVNPLPILNNVLVIGGVNVCASGTRTLLAVPNNTTLNTYLWNTGATTTSITVSPTSTTSYTVVATNTLGCSKQATATVNVLPPSSITVSASSQTICAGQNTTLTASGANFYSWNPSSSIYPPANGSSVVAHPTTSTVYTVTGSVASCSATQTIAIIVNPTPTIAITNTAICTGSSATLTANGASSYNWNTGATTNTISVTPSSTTTYSVIGSSAFGCTATAVATVSVSPNPSVTVNSATICIGQSATLTANGASTYSWSTGQTTNSIVVTPTSTTDYTVIGTNLAGCAATAISNVNVVTAPTSISATASNIYPIIGTSVNITTNVTPPGAYTYVWAPNIGNTANPSFTPTDNGVYVCTVSNACGTATTSLCINVESTLCGNASAVTIGTQTLSSNTTYNNTSVTITGTLTLAGANNYNFNSSVFKMSTDAKIIVEPTARLAIVGSQIFSCEGMWYGIETQSSAAQSATVSVKQSSIEDAYNSVVMDNLSSHENNFIETSTTILNKNYIDISVSNAKLTTTIYSLTVLTTTMSSAASNTSPGNSLKCSNFYPAGVPLVKARSYAGLFADNAQYIEFIDNNFSVFNQVSNKDYGLFFKKTNAWVYNVQFSNIVGTRSILLTPGGTPPLPIGVGIYHTGKEFLKAMPYTTAVPNALLFTNVAYGIVTNKTPYVDVEQASFINPAQYRIFGIGSSVETGIGLNAVYTIDAFGLLRVNKNTILDELNAITASYNTLPTSTSYTFSLSQNNIGTSIATTSLSTGIDVMGVTTLPFNGQMGDQVIAANTIKNVSNTGIRLLGVQTPNGVRVSGNSILLKDGATGSKTGISLSGANGNILVDNNDINGGLTASPVGNFNINCNGIRSQSSPGCFIQCNTITQVGKGVVYSGNNLTSGPYAAAGFYHNYLTYPMRRGLELNNGGIIGTQGNSSGASANQWIGFVNILGVDQTFVGGGFPASNAANSILWVRNIVGSERPLDNQNAAPSTPADRYQGASLPLLANGVNDIETAPSYSDCPTPLNSGAKVALTVPLNITQRNVDYSTLITSAVTATATIISPQQKWQLKQHMHKAIRQTQVGANSTVANFYVNEQNGDVAKYYVVDSLMSIGDTALAKIKNSTAPVNNAIEQTHHDFNNLYLSGIHNQADYTALQTIANLCAYKYGNAVYQARALLNIVTYGNQSWEEDNCEDDKSDGRMGNFDNAEEGVALTETIKANVYPNPNSGLFIVAYDLQKETDIEVVIADISGKVVYKAALDNLNNLQTINLNDVQNGIYFVQLVNNEGKLIWTDKIIISK